MWFHISSQKKKKKTSFFSLCFFIFFSLCFFTFFSLSLSLSLCTLFLQQLWNIFSTQVFPCLQKYSETRLLFYFLKIIKTTESINIAAKIIWKKKKKIEWERESVRFWKVSFYKFSPLYSWFLIYSSVNEWLILYLHNLNFTINWLMKFEGIVDKEDNLCHMFKVQQNLVFEISLWLILQKKYSWQESG